MNIEQAKAIPISEILDKLNVKLKQSYESSFSCLSPLRTERTPSFHVDTLKNVWFDHGAGMGGDGITLVQKHLENSGVSHTISDALRWMSNMLGLAPRIVPVKDPDTPTELPKLCITNKQAIQRPALVQYLDSRGIPLSVAQEYLSEINVYNRTSKKTIFALGFENDNGGHEIRNQFYKGATRPKYITFIRGEQGGQGGGINIFEGFMDYLSAIIQQQDGQKFKDDTIVLNSLSLLTKATPYIKGYGYTALYSWMDNDETGRDATVSLREFCQTEENLLHKPMNGIYAPYKDVNAFHMVKLGLAAG